MDLLCLPVSWILDFTVSYKGIDFEVYFYDSSVKLNLAVSFFDISGTWLKLIAEYTFDYIDDEGRGRQTGCKKFS